MRRILLTSSQVSLVLSGIITLAFTLLLFLSGLFLQRRTLHSLQQTLAPRLPPIPASHFIAPDNSPSSRHFSSSYKDHIASASYNTQQAAIPWSRLAHVQFPTSHHEVCSAVMLFADLHRLKSPAKRVLVFPSEWLGSEGNKGTTGQGGMGKVRADVSDPWMATTRRLLRVAGRRYGVQLRPVSPRYMGKGKSQGKGWFGLGTEEVIEDEGKELEGKKLATLLGMHELERALLVRTPGWVLDASGLDAALAYSSVEGIATLTSANGTDAVLLKTADQPSSSLSTTSTTPGSSPADSSHHLVSPSELDRLLTSGLPLTPLLPALSTSLLTSIGTLHSPSPEETFNATHFLASTSYITFTDPKLPAGPEYDVPFADKVRARPMNKDADWVWTKLYGMFAERRREVCGLDLEWIPPS
ncbi:hypothetical protein BDZ85DRAFT_315633 [Elsinoe ampelina]|uniref:Uncharacterized protein n=1 Tax=Elsinoe ampelina TaxID=302913 RepID=A0A6A6GQY5_9PEZI|nr:hypothetical protein BDZ85DRAFT_315633 [Elsinoe ampelina]